MKFLPLSARIILPLVLSDRPITGQETVLFDHLTLEQGLSQSTVEAIVQDNQGLLWFGTNDGLNRFDGYEFVTFRNDPADPNSISDNYIYSMCVDSSGFIWIGTNNGLNRLDAQRLSLTRYLHDPRDPKSISHPIVMSVTVDACGNIWAGTLGGGLNLYNRSDDGFVHFQHDSLVENTLSDDMITRLEAARTGDLWIGTFYGWINRIDREVLSSIRSLDDPGELSGTIPVERYFLPGRKSNRIREEFVWAIEDDGAGGVWIGTRNDGLFHYDPRSREIRNYRMESHPELLGSNNVQSLQKDDGGVLWIGTDVTGLTRLETSRLIATNYRHRPDDSRSLSDKSVWSLFRDRNGVLWIGTDFGGVNFLDPRRFVFEHYSTRNGALEDNQVWAFHEGRDGVIWIGTDGGGLTSFNPATRSFTTLRHDPINRGTLSNDFVMSVSEGAGDVIWIGTAGGGLNLFDPLTGRFDRIQPSSTHAKSVAPRNIRAILPTETGHLWVGSFGSGLFHFNTDNRTFTPALRASAGMDYTVPSFINCLLKDSTNALWIGTQGEGLFRYEPATTGLKRFANNRYDDSSLANDKINTLYIDRKGKLWVGTSGGLCSFEPTTGRFACYTTKDGLPNEVIYGILEDQSGSLWLSTNKGISRFHPSTNSFLNFTVRDGLQSYEFNRGAALESRDGRMYFGGVNGFNVFLPGKMRLDETPPPVVITSFKIMNREQNLAALLRVSNPIEMGPEVIDFSFKFAALDYTNAEKNQYAYRMEGIDDDWIHIGTRRSASYAHLPGGEYTFRVKGTNSDGIWNEIGTAVRISIVPPFWQTWWFQGSVLLTFLTIGVVSYRIRVSTLERDKHAQQETSRRLIELQEQERRRIASGLHDSLGQNLLILKNSIENTASRHRLTAEVSTELGDLSLLAHEALSEVREISFDLHPHVLDRLGLVKGIETIVEKMSRVSQIPITTDLCETNGLLVKGMEINLYRIVQEALSNIVKHSRASGATVSIQNRDGRLRLEVADNGRGFDAEQFLTRPAHERSLGLIDIAERVRLLDGSFHYVSSPGQGATLTVDLPPKGS